MIYTNNFKKCLQGFATYRFYKKYDYTPLDKLRMFLSDDWEIDTEINMRGVIFIRNKLSNVNTKIIKNDLLFTDMDYVSTLCKSLIQRHERSYFSPFQNYDESSYNKDLEVSASPTPKESQKAIPSLNPGIKSNFSFGLQEVKK